MKLELELLQPVRLTPARFRILKALYEAKGFILGQELGRICSVVNYSQQICFLRDLGIETTSHYVPNPASTPDQYLVDLKKYRIKNKCRALASISLTAYQNRNKEKK